MNYFEFAKTYKWMLSKYPCTSQIFNDDLENKIIGEVITERYIKNGTKWNKTEENTEALTAIKYANIVDAIPFFRRLGGRETVEMNYTYAGYIPSKISSLSPSRDEKTVRKFKIFK